MHALDPTRKTNGTWITVVQDIWPETNQCFLPHLQRQWICHLGDNEKGKIIGKGETGKQISKIHNVVLVDGLKHNLLSISQLCDIGNKVIFGTDMCSIQSAKDNKIFFVANRNGNMCPMNFSYSTKQNLKGFGHWKWSVG